MAGMISIFGLGYLLAWITALVWIYGDAENRGQSGCLITLLIFFTGWLGILIWLLLRESISPPRHQPIGYEPTPKPAYTGKRFFRELNQDYWRWKNQHISDQEFQARKDLAISELKNWPVIQVEEFLGDLVPFVESKVLTDQDIEKIRHNLSREVRAKELENKRMDPRDKQLVVDYLRTLEPRLRDELRQRGIPTDTIELVAKLDTPKLIDLYRETRSVEMANELKKRNLHQYL